jgi:DNA-binding CsgD family transcriptional regulator
MAHGEPMRVPSGLILLMAVQLVCAAFFVTDAVQDYVQEGGLRSVDWHLAFETLATLSLLVAIAVEGRILAELLKKKAGLERSLHLASAEVEAVIEAQFEEWRLSPAETDIAMFLVKGLGTQEIADMRGSAEGTVKAHFNAIFRKAGVHSRTELLSVLIDRLLGERLNVAPQVSAIAKSG